MHVVGEILTQKTLNSVLTAHLFTPKQLIKASFSFFSFFFALLLTVLQNTVCYHLPYRQCAVRLWVCQPQLFVDCNNDPLLK